LNAGLWFLLGRFIVSAPIKTASQRSSSITYHPVQFLGASSFFEQPWILVRDVDRFIAEDARHLIWAHGIKPKDAIHLATALRLKLSVMDTFDDDLIALSGKLGNPRLSIGHPNMPHTPDMFPGTKQGVAAKRGKRAKRARG
jgi:hypothetical protein